MASYQTHTCHAQGCNNRCQVQPNGVLYDYCSRSCATRKQICIRPGCSNPRYVENGRAHDYCGRTCAASSGGGSGGGVGRNPVTGGRARPAPTSNSCSRPGCFNPRYVENGRAHDYCGRTCAASSGGGSGRNPGVTYNATTRCHETPTMVLFYDESCPFSQWSAHSFVHDNITYKTAEHFMMYKKAILMRDFNTAQKILTSSGPAEAKKLGRQISPFSPTRWNNQKQEVVHTGNMLKFSQNADIWRMLCATKGKKMVEAAGNDKVWGCGLVYTDPRIHNPKNWKGKNLLGNALDQVKSKLC